MIDKEVRVLSLLLYFSFTCCSEATVAVWTEINVQPKQTVFYIPPFVKVNFLINHLYLQETIKKSTSIWVFWVISKVILLSQEPVHILFTALTSIRDLHTQKIQNIAVFIATLMPMTCVISIFCIMVIVTLVISILKVQLEALQ